MIVTLRYQLGYVRDWLPGAYKNTPRNKGISPRCSEYTIYLIKKVKPMADSPKEKLSVEDLLMSQAYALQAIINLLDKKGIVTRDEIVSELKTMQATIFDNKISTGREN
jgi:hypothetical protein